MTKNGTYRDGNGKIYAYSSKPGCVYGEVLGVRIDERMGRIESNLGDFKLIVGDVKNAVNDIAKKVEVAIKMARDSAGNTHDCKQAVEQSKKLLSETKQDNLTFKNKLFTGIIVAMAIYILVGALTAIPNWIALQEKKRHIEQDKVHQEQTVKYLNNIDHGVKIEGGIKLKELTNAINTLPEIARLKIVRGIKTSGKNGN